MCLYGNKPSVLFCSMQIDFGSKFCFNIHINGLSWNIIQPISYVGVVTK